MLDVGRRNRVTARDHTSRLRELVVLQSENRHLDKQAKDRAARNRKLIRLLRNRNLFVGALSHELRTSISIIAGFARLLRRRVDAPCRDRLDYLAGIDRTVEHATNLLTRALTVARLGSRRFRKKNEPVRLKVLIDGIVRDYQQVAAMKDVELRACVDEGMSVCTDPDLLRQCILNLVENATRYSPGGTTVHITARTDTNGIHLAVIDRGPGITREEVATVFEPFAGTKAGDMYCLSGAGLGLFIVRHIVEDGLHGRVTLESQVGKGTTVNIELPVDNPAPDPGLEGR